MKLASVASAGISRELTRELEALSAAEKIQAIG
jgi:hypothetical protein